MSISAEEIPQPDSRHAAILRDALEPGEDRLLARIVVDKAKSGDGVALRFVLGQLYPRPKGRPIALDLPAGTGRGNVVSVFDALLRALAAGEAAPAEALTVMRVLDGRRRVLEAWNRERLLRLCYRFTTGGGFAAQKPEAGVDWRDDEADAAKKPAGLAAGATSEAMRGTARAPSSAPASPPAGAPSPANHLHPQAASLSGAGTDKGAGTGKSGSGDTADRLHSACIELVSSGQARADTAPKRESVAAMSRLP